jgi:hypothetical protein
VEARIETDQKPVKAEIKSDLVRGETMNVETNSKEKDAAGKWQEVPNEEAAVEAIGALKDRYEDRHLVVWCRGWCAPEEFGHCPKNGDCTAQRM